LVYTVTGPCAATSRFVPLEETLEEEDDDEEDADDDTDLDRDRDRLDREESELYDPERRLLRVRDDTSFFLDLREDGDGLPEALRLRLRLRDRDRE
jgi:hypothetical protein